MGAQVHTLTPSLAAPVRLSVCLSVCLSLYLLNILYYGLPYLTTSSLLFSSQMMMMMMPWFVFKLKFYWFVTKFNTVGAMASTQIYILVFCFCVLKVVYQPPPHSKLWQLLQW